jgi:hypothetical protein
MNGMSDQPSNFDSLDDQVGWYGRKPKGAQDDARC